MKKSFADILSDIDSGTERKVSKKIPGWLGAEIPSALSLEQCSSEAAADYKQKGMTLYDGLINLYEKYGFYAQKLETLTLSGIDGSEKIKEMMHRFRSEELPFEVVKKLDCKDGLDGLPKSDVLKFILANGWFAVRPSGTEPKIKFYFETFSDTLEDAQDSLNNLRLSVTALT